MERRSEKPHNDRRYKLIVLLVAVIGSAAAVVSAYAALIGMGQSL